MNIDLSLFTFDAWLDGVITVLAMLFSGSFMANIVLVGALVVLVLLVAAFSGTFGTDENSPIL